MGQIKKIKKYPAAQQKFVFSDGDNDPPIKEEIEIWEVPNALVTMYGSVIKKGKNIDFFTSPRHRGSIGIKTIIASHFFKKKIRVKGTVISFVYGWYDNYYHFVAECLPKLFVLKDYLEDSFIAFPKEVKKFHKEYLGILGIKNIIYIDKNEVIKADKVVSCNFMNRDLNHHHIITPQFRNWIISKIDMSKNNDLPKSFFVNREKALHGRVVNNEEVKSELGHLKNINLEDYSVLDQIKLFHQAKEIQAVHGASLTNLLFCKEKTFVREYINIKYKVHCFTKLAGILNLRYSKVECKGNNTHELPRYCDIIIPLNKFK